MKIKSHTHIFVCTGTQYSTLHFWFRVRKPQSIFSQSRTDYEGSTTTVGNLYSKLYSTRHVQRIDVRYSKIATKVENTLYLELR